MVKWTVQLVDDRLWLLPARAEMGWYAGESSIRTAAPGEGVCLWLKGTYREIHFPALSYLFSANIASLKIKSLPVLQNYKDYFHFCVAAM